MNFAKGQSKGSRWTKRVLGRRLYDLAKATRVAYPMRRATYSQHGEDQVLADLLPQTSGVYLDIGAGNPIHLSNTYSFYRRGWSGVLVDPLWANSVLARMLRPRDVIVRGLASLKPQRLEFFELDPSFYSTTDREVAERLMTNGIALQRIPR
jgi:hypothetical protein